MAKLIRISEEAHRELKSEAAMQGLTMEILAERIIKSYRVNRVNGSAVAREQRKDERQGSRAS